MTLINSLKTDKPFMITLQDCDGKIVGSTTHKIANGAYLYIGAKSYPSISFQSNMNSNVKPATLIQTTDTYRDRLGDVSYSSYGRPTITIDAYLDVLTETDTCANYLATPVSKGAWSGATAYVFGDWVTLGGVSYICNTNHTNNTPPNTSYWDVYTAISSTMIIPLNVYLLFNLQLLNHRMYLKDIAPSKQSSCTNWSTPINILMNRKDIFNNVIFDSTKGMPVIVRDFTLGDIIFDGSKSENMLQSVKITLELD